MATVQLVCDVCGTERQGKPGWSIADLRQLLTQVGWHCGDRDADADVCASCRDGGYGP